MSTTPATPQAVRPARFFALTADRLNAVVLHRLTRAELLVWSHVELHARPRQPAPFTLEGIAVRLELGVDTVRRAVRRLLHVGLLVGMFQGNRYRLAPATSAFENLAPVPGSQVPGLAELRGDGDDQADENLEPLPGDEGHDLAPVQGSDPEEGRHDLAGGSPPETYGSEKKKRSFMACALTRELTGEWGLYRAVAVRLVATHGRDRVRQVLEWGRHLKDAGKLKSRGWVYQALVRGWDAPDGFHAARHKAQEGASKPAQVSQDPPPAPAPADEPLDEAGKIETLRAMYGKPMPALKRLAVKLAGDWGVPLEAFGARAV